MKSQSSLFDRCLAPSASSQICSGRHRRKRKWRTWWWRKKWKSRKMDNRRVGRHGMWSTRPHELAKQNWSKFRSKSRGSSRVRTRSIPC